MDNTFKIPSLLIIIFTFACSSVNDDVVRPTKNKTCEIFKGKEECRDIRVDCLEEDPFVKDDLQCGFGCDNKDAVAVCENFGGICDHENSCHLVLPDKCLAITMKCQGTEEDSNCCGACVNGYCE